MTKTELIKELKDLLSAKDALIYQLQAENQRLRSYPYSYPMGQTVINPNLFIPWSGDVISCPSVWSATTGKVVSGTISGADLYPVKPADKI